MGGPGRAPRSFTTADGVVDGVSFAVWAPNAKGVSLIGEFNHWDGNEAPLRVAGIDRACGSCSGPASPSTGCTSSASTAPTVSVTDRADPMAFATEVPPQHRVAGDPSDYTWGDDDWMTSARARIRCSSR